MLTPAHPDPQAFATIVRDNESLVFRTLARLLPRSLADQATLEDLAQDVFLRLHRALPTFRGESALTTYLYRIVVNVAADHARRAARDRRRNISLSTPLFPGDANAATLEDQLPHPDLTPDRHLQHAQFALAVEHHLARLSPVERTALVLYHQEDQTYEQIALTLSLPLNTVRTHLHRARKKLREALLANPPQPATPPHPKRVQYAL